MCCEQDCSISQPEAAVSEGSHKLLYCTRLQVEQRLNDTSGASCSGAATTMDLSSRSRLGVQHHGFHTVEYSIRKACYVASAVV